MKKEELKEKCVNLFLEGKNYTEIAKLTGYSRQYISKLIKEDERVKERLNKKIIKVNKLKNSSRFKLSLSTEFLSKIGISKDYKKSDYIEIKLNEKSKTITIKKQKKI